MLQGDGDTASIRSRRVSGSRLLASYQLRSLPQANDQQVKNSCFFCVKRHTFRPGSNFGEAQLPIAATIAVAMSGPMTAHVVGLYCSFCRLRDYCLACVQAIW